MGAEFDGIQQVDRGRGAQEEPAGEAVGGISSLQVKEGRGEGLKEVDKTLRGVQEEHVG